MIRRSVRRAFHTVWWRPPDAPLTSPSIVIANHHGWHDGYLAYLAATKLSLPFVMWVQELKAFPLFARAGAMPFDADDQAIRVRTIRQTIRLLRQGERSLILFPEGVLHWPPEIAEFGRSLNLLRRKVPAAPIVPLAIRYELAMHERPEAYLAFGNPLGRNEEPRAELERLLSTDLRSTHFEVLAHGTRDVNERWDMRRFRSH